MTRVVEIVDSVGIEMAMGGSSNPKNEQKADKRSTRLVPKRMKESKKKVESQN